MTLLAWHDDVWLAEHEREPVDLLVADSWLVEDARSLALGLHRTRFTTSVEAQGGDAAIAGAAFDALREHIPAHGAWFPRIEFGGDEAGFVARVRPAPPRFTATTLITAPDDPRTTPKVKGPDLEALATLRLFAAAHEADEAVVLSDGIVVEGAGSSIVWWRDGRLHHPPAEAARIDSVTERSVLGVAAARGIAIVEQAATPAELEGAEVWALSALHGIRAALGWVDGPELAAPKLAPAWQRILGALRR